MVFMGNGTAGMAFITSVADIRCPVKPAAAFFDKILTVLVAGGAGSAFGVAENDLAADILFLAVKAVDAEVFCIQEEAPAGIEVG